MIKLNNSTIKLISSSYVISSIETVIKELVENSIDAESTRIFINLKRFGLDKIDVIDNGQGFLDATLICQRHCTSKISNFSDIECVETFGFRGEVLSSICAVSNLTITSNSDASVSPIGRTWVFDKMGQVIANSAAACNQGTTISVSNIFHNLPVRCQMYKSLYVLQKSLKAIIHILFELYLSRKNIHIKLLNDNNTILNLPSSSTRKDSISFVIGTSKTKFFTELNKSEQKNDGHMLEMNLFIPNCTDDDNTGLSNQDYKNNCYLFINNRPVEIPILFKVFRKVYSEFKDNRLRYPVFFLYLVIPSSWIDVNIDPEKRKVKLRYIDQITDFVESTLKEFYKSIFEESKLINFDKTENEIDNVFNDADLFSNSPPLPIEEIVPIQTVTSNERVESPVFEMDNSDLSFCKDSLSEIEINQKSVSSLTEPCDFHNDRFQKNFHLGRLECIKDHPVSNVNLKRSITTDIDLETMELKKRSKNSGASEISEKMHLNTSESINISNREPAKAHNSARVSLESLEKENEFAGNLLNKNEMRVISVWDSFVICADSMSLEKGVHKEENDLVIYHRDNLIFTSIYFKNIASMQVPAMKLVNPIVIDQSNLALSQELEKCPIQLIFNKVTNQQFYIISCPHLIKNGFRLHSIKEDNTAYFEIVSKPVCVDETIIFDELSTILRQSTNSTDIVRTNTIRKWIFSSSQEKVKIQLEDKQKISKTNVREYLDSCMLNLNKYRLSDRLEKHLPELFRFSLNKF